MTHDTILAAARRRFLQWGYSGTSISALADDLGLTKAALYYHFADKEALFVAVVHQYLDEVAADLGPLRSVFDAGDPSALEALSAVFLRRHESSAQIQQLTFQESRHLTPPVRQELSRVYHEKLVSPVSALLDVAVGRGWIRGPLPGEPATIWIYFGLMTAFLQPGHTPPEGTVSAFVSVFRGALAPLSPSVRSPL